MLSLSRMLTPARRLPWLLINLVLGIAPSLLFFAWVERNCALPASLHPFSWPWIDLMDQSVIVRGAFDFAIFLIFGAVHSIFAQTGVQKAMARTVPVEAVRAAYLAISGVCLVVLMGCWQSTGLVVWVWPLSTLLNTVFSLVLFWGFMAGSGYFLKGFDPLHFVGLRQLYQKSEQIKHSAGAPSLIDTGIYGVVRHPIYLFTSLAFIVAPLMTLDRTILIAAMILYLSIGIPIEERKLVTLFGEAYLDYRKRVPAFIPGLLLP